MITEIRVSVDYFEHLLNCLAQQKYIHEQESYCEALRESPEKIEENQKIIDEAWRTGMDIIRPVIKQNNLSKYAIQRFNEKWEKDLPRISTSFGMGDKIDKDKFLLWGFVRQELEMLCLIGEQVSFDELAELCERKKLDLEMKSYIIETLEFVGLGECL